jgi:hypothetical protein
MKCLKSRIMGNFAISFGQSWGGESLGWQLFAASQVLAICFRTMVTVDGLKLLFDQLSEDGFRQ